MRRMIFLIILFKFTAVSNAAVARKAIVFGGGCEDQINRFIPVMESQAQGLKKNGWDVQTLFSTDTFDGGEDELTKASGTSVKSANKESLLKELDDVIADENFKSGSSLLLTINTHGMKSPKGGHIICISKDPLSGFTPAVEMNLNDPEIIKRLDILKSKNIKMGFTDMSCYGGESVSFLSKYGCVVTSQTDNITATTYGVSGSLANLLNLPNDKLKNKLLNENGKITLEDIFIDTALHGQDYKTVNDRGQREYPQQPTSSMMPDISSPSETINSLLTYKHPIEFTDADLRCFYADKSFSKINDFIEQLSDPVNLSLLESLSGRKISNLDKFKEDLKNTIIERARVHDVYVALAEKEKRFNSALSNIFNKPTFEIELSEELTLLLPYLERAVSQSITDDGIKVINGENNKLGINVDLSKIRNNLFEKPDQEIAKDLRSELSGILGLNSPNSKMPSQNEIEKLVEKITSETRKNITKEKVDQLRKLYKEKNENALQFKALAKSNPYLEGEKINQVSRDFNLLTAAHHLRERQKWKQMSTPPKSFTDCADFELN